MISYVAIGLQFQICKRSSRKQLLAGTPHACEFQKAAPLQLQPYANPALEIFRWQIAFVEIRTSRFRRSEPNPDPSPGVVVEEPDPSLLEG